MRLGLALALGLLLLPALANPIWWDPAWDYRTCFEVNSTQYDRMEWPIEFSMNLTADSNSPVNETSLRLWEQNTSTGNLMYQLPFQFDKVNDFNSTNNFVGTLAFIMNGTTSANEVRTFCLYYDDGGKSQLNFAEIPYSWDGEEFNINISIMDGGTLKGLKYWLDTKRGANASGIYRVRDFSGNDYWATPGENELPTEYIQYSNSTDNFTFDLRNNLTVVYAGPARVVVEQRGPEVFWNSSAQTGQGRIVKRYTFYNQSQWFKVEQEYTNTYTASIIRQSTPAGALAWEVHRSLLDNIILGSSTDPGSYWWFAAEFANFHLGVINVNESGADFTAVDRNSTNGKGGIELSSTSISPGQTIFEEAAIHFNGPSQIRGSPTDAQVKNLKNRLIHPERIVKTLTEKWATQIVASTDHTNYNRGENVTLFVNATVDTGMIDKVNGTVSSDDGIFDFDFYDDGTHGDEQAGDGVYTNYFVLNDTNSTGRWNFTAYAWYSTGMFLNQSTTHFFVFDEYKQNLSIVNKYGYVNRTINATLTVMNYRRDAYISDANITCFYNGTNAHPNVTDYANGTYLIQFTAPSTYGIYWLTCNSTKFNNTGVDFDSFTNIEYTTNVSASLFLLHAINNITLDYGQTVILEINISNIRNGVAYNVNLSLSIPSTWSINSSFEKIGDLNLTEFATKYFSLTVPANETPTIYKINTSVVWDNADGTNDETNQTHNVSVLENPVLQVPETALVLIGKPGTVNDLGNITVLSIGNFKLLNVTFNVTGIDANFSFVPENISSLFQGDNQSVRVLVDLPADFSRGNHTGVLNISSENDGFDLVNITIQIIETTMSANATPSTITADNVRWYAFQNFTVFVNTSNIGPSTALAVNLTLELPDADWITNVSSNKYTCGDLLSGEWCYGVFEVGIKASEPGEYNITANITWDNPGVGLKTNTSIVKVTVSSNPIVGIDETEVNGTAHHGQTTTVGSYTLKNLGNDQIDGVSTSVIGLSDFTITFSPTVNFVPVGNVISVAIDVSVPLGYAPGNYSGIVNVTSTNGGYDWFDLNIEVPADGSWTMTPKNCSKEVAFNTGKMCDVLINNTGNIPVNFTILPNATNYTYVNETNFTILAQNTHIFSILWDLTGVPRDYYNATYNVTSTGSPSWEFLNISMIPRELAQINMSVSTNVTGPYEDVVVFANVTDKSQTGLNYTDLVVYLPDGTQQRHAMTQYNVSNHTYFYNLSFPGTWGSNLIHGEYTLLIETQDNLGLISTNNMSIYVYPQLKISINTPYETYFSGETMTMFVNLTDLGDLHTDGNITIWVKDSEGYLRFNETYTDDGLVEPLPSFTIPSDAPLGNYTIYASARRYDAISGNLSTAYTNYTFKVREIYNLEFSTSFVWYPNNVLNFYTLLYSDQEFDSPDLMNLTVYNPTQQVLFTTDSFTEVHADNKSRLYVYRYALPATASVGDYLAIMTVKEGGRQLKKMQAFRLSFGGPFDVIIDSLEPEVPAGTYQNFTIVLKNMGDLSQDVFLDYWISKDNTTYSKVTGQAIYVPAGGNVTLSRSLYVYSNQPTGNYTLNVKLNYSQYVSPITTTQTFLVVASNQTNKTRPKKEQPPEVVTPVEAAVIELTVTNVFPEQLVLNRGTTGYVTIEVKNTGDVTLTDITAFFDDVNVGWYEVNKAIDSLEPGETGYLVVKFTVPSDAVARTYVSKMRIVSKETEASEFYKIIIFKTQQDALRAKISILRSKLLDLEGEAGTLAARGIDVTYILTQIKKSRELLDVAENFLDEDRIVDAITTISEVETNIEDIKYRVQISKPRVLPPVTVPHIPPSWYVWIAWFISGSVLIFIIFKKVRKSKKREKLKAVSRLKQVLEKKETAAGSSSDLKELLRKQYEEGMLSRETFEELKSLLK